jgi:hypothetical protein
MGTPGNPWENGGGRPHPFDNLGALPGHLRLEPNPILGEKEAPRHLGGDLVALRGPRLPSLTSLHSHRALVAASVAAGAPPSKGPSEGRRAREE